MTFADYAGNPRAVETVRRMVATGQFPPSLMFTGPKGVGKFILATLLATTVNCEGNAADPCGNCGVCRSLSPLADIEKMRQEALKERGSANPEDNPLILRPHPNVTVLTPDGAFIRVSQMRYVVRHAYSEPEGNGRLFFLIDQAERLRGDLADVLLKVLEEPPPRTTLVLITHEPYRLRATVRSRCIPLYFNPLEKSLVIEQLKALRPEWKKTERELAASVSAGSPGKAVNLDLEEYRKTRTAALEVLRTTGLRRMNPERLFPATAELAGKTKSTGEEKETGASGAEGFDFILEVIYSLLNDVLYLKSGQPKESLRNPDVARELQELADGAGASWVEETTAQLDRLAGLQRQNVNRQLSLDSLALRSAEVVARG